MGDGRPKVKCTWKVVEGVVECLTVEGSSTDDLPRSVNMVKNRLQVSMKLSLLLDAPLLSLQTSWITDEQHCRKRRDEAPS